MVQNSILSRIIALLFLSVISLFSNIKCEIDSINDTKEDIKEDYKRWDASDYWQNHKPYYNYIYAKNREAKSNNEPYFTEPSNNEGYETMPSTIQITAIPAGGFGAGAPGLFPGQLPDHFNPFPNALNSFQKFPVFVINKSKGGSDHFKWLIPLLLILGAPLLCGLLLIPVALQGVFFFLTIARNLGILLPLIPAITGLGGNGGNPIIPATG